MAFINENGENVSYECTYLIDELKQDIEEFGGDTIVAVWCKQYEGVAMFTNYDFIEDEKPLEDYELKDGEYIKKMTMSALLLLLKKQNEFF